MVKNKFDSKKHVDNIISDNYYKNLILLRNKIEIECDNYFQKLGAPKVDLYLISNSVSSPMALGSDSQPIEFNFDNKNYFLTDSSQFGMEPLLFNSFDMVYCYLPSFRGEVPDKRHLNQFFHCEAEMKGGYEDVMNVAEGLVKHLTKTIINSLKQEDFCFDQLENLNNLERVVSDKFLRIKFDDAVKLLEDNGHRKLVEYKKFGRVLTNEAESMITKLVGNNTLPVWVTNYDRDSVAFYQKPDPKNNSTVLNADLLVPSFSNNGFVGEILGLGQRQDNSLSIIESMDRQKINNTGQYDWYVKLRNNKDYCPSSGFGMGIERYISWILMLNSIADASIYPVMKGVKTVY